MKRLFTTIIIIIQGMAVMAQRAAKDEAQNHQQERMVFKQWDRKKFTPSSGFLGLNPLHLMTWGLHPNYRKTDRRPLSPTGPQTQRLGLTKLYDEQANKLRLESDTVASIAQGDILRTSGALAFVEPLWVMYYSKELKFPMNATASEVIASIPPKIASQVTKGNGFTWYMEELAMLKERIDGARTADMDRGSRIIAYHRLLIKYRSLHEQWMNHLASFELGLKQAAIKKVSTQTGGSFNNPPKSDKQIARDVVNKNKGLGGF